MQNEEAQKDFEKHNGSELTVQDFNDIKAEAETMGRGSYGSTLWYAIWFAYTIGWVRGYHANESPCQPGED